MPVLVFQCLPHPQSAMLSPSFFLHDAYFARACPVHPCWACDQGYEYPIYAMQCQDLLLTLERGMNLSFSHSWGGDFPGTTCSAPRKDREMWPSWCCGTAADQAKLCWCVVLGDGDHAGAWLALPRMQNTKPFQKDLWMWSLRVAGIGKWFRRTLWRLSK